jgi:putative endonuclease
MFYFYILKCKDGTLYSGSTKNLRDRVAKHNSGKGSKYVQSRGGGNVVYFEKFRSWNKTLKREAEVKKWSRYKKLNLIKNYGKPQSFDNGSQRARGRHA